MTYNRPGVYATEQTLPNVVAVGSRVAVAAFLGTSLQGPTTPTKIESWGAFQTRFGGFTAANDLPYSVYHYFANGGRTAWVTRVVGTGALASTNNVAGSYGPGTSTAGTVLTISAANPGVWGNSITYSATAVSAPSVPFDLTVLSNGTQVEVFKSLSMVQTDPRYAETIVNSANTGSTYINVSVPSTVDTAIATGGGVSFVAQNGVALAAGAAGATPSGSDWGNAVTAQSSVEGPFLLNLVGQSDANIINNAMTFASGRQDVFVIIDPDATSSQAGTINTVPVYSTSSYGAVYFPRLLMIDPNATVTGGTRITYPGGALAGLYVSTDASRGVFKAPAGTSSRITGAIALEYRPTDTELGTLNDNHINAFKLIPGGSIVAFGARTLKHDTIDAYIPARRSLIFLKKTLSDVTAFAVFEPNDTRLWATVTSLATGVLNDFWLQGGLKGKTAAEAYFVTCDASNNTPATVAAGEVHLTVGAALQAPAEFVIINIGQWSGGTTTTSTV